MPSPDIRSRSHSIGLGLAFVAAGGALVLVGLGVIPVDPASVHSPMWVLTVCGAVFGFGGIAAMMPEGSPVGSAAAGMIVLCLAAVFGWVALAGAGDQFSGGLPFLSREANVVVSRVVFGLGALLGLAMFVGGTISLIRGARER